MLSLILVRIQGGESSAFTGRRLLLGPHCWLHSHLFVRLRSGQKPQHCPDKRWVNTGIHFSFIIRCYIFLLGILVHCLTLCVYY
jgi:hypothetical protein